MKRKRKKNKPTPRLLPSVVVDYWRYNEELPGLWDLVARLLPYPLRCWVYRIVYPI